MSVVDRGIPAPDGPAIDPRSVLGVACSRFASIWPACLVLYWGAVAIGWLAFTLLNLFLAALNEGIGDPAFTPFLRFIQFVGLFLIPAWLWIGQGIAFLKLAREEPVTPEDLFRGGPLLLTMVLAILGALAIAAVPCLAVYGSAEALLALSGESMIAMVRDRLPEKMPDDLAHLQSLWMVVSLVAFGMVGLCYLAAFAVRVRLRTVPFLIIDRHAGVGESLSTSMRLSRGRASSLFLIHLAQLTINFAGLLLCCAGLFVTLPLTRLISAITYDRLSIMLPPIELSEEDGEDEA